MFTSFLMGFIISVIIACIYGWKLTLVVLSCVPVLLLSNYIVLRVRIMINLLIT